MSGLNAQVKELRMDGWMKLMVLVDLIDAILWDRPNPTARDGWRLCVMQHEIYC